MIDSARITRTAAETSALADAWRSEGLSVGLVPTMGALHDGHGSLIRRAARECDRVIVSDFVNPLQFGAGEDFDAYPRTEEHDLALATAAGADILFAPGVEDVYPEGNPPPHMLDAGPVGDILEGASRPGHFDGMLTVVDRLFDIAGTCRTYFGEKDAQQLFLVQRLAAERHPDITVVPCPIVREPDGLAMSSRNTYLTPEQRAAAPIVNRALVVCASLVTAGFREPDELRAAMAETVAPEPLAALDYAEIVDLATFSPVLEPLEEGRTYRALIAVKLGIPRLLDNLAIHVHHSCRIGNGRSR